MNDIFNDMQAKTGCTYISDLPFHKLEVWQELKQLDLADYEETQLEDLCWYVFHTSHQLLIKVIRQQKQL